MSVLVATTYMKEAERFDHLMVMDTSRVLTEGRPTELRAQTSSASLENPNRLLPEKRRRGHQEVTIPALTGSNEIAKELIMCLTVRGRQSKYSTFAPRR